jgi:glucose-1-phosphate thymidylyltransferase
VNNRYIERGELQYSHVRGAWTDAGTFESLQEANALLLSIGNKIRA